jgi:hypothetical protein
MLFRPGRVTIVGHCILGTTDKTHRANAQRLAKAAGVTALVVGFRHGALLSASPWIDIADGAVVEALASHYADKGGAP